MGYSLGWDSDWNRDIGYGVPSICDQPRCRKRIDRGMYYHCGAGGENGCGLFFCDKHRSYGDSLCDRCLKKREPYEAKKDTKDWIQHKMTHPGWAKWRESQRLGGRQ